MEKYQYPESPLSQLILCDSFNSSENVAEEIESLYNPSDITTCMCSKEEFEYRKRCGTISVFEISEPQYADLSNLKTLVPNQCFSIKKYERSQAEYNEIIPRSLDILYLCFKYISLEISDCFKNEFSTFYNIINQYENPKLKTYDFACDRYRCIVQDLTVLNQLDQLKTVEMLEGIIRYHLWAEFSLQKLSGFDNVLNMQRIMNCFTLLFEAYEANSQNCQNKIEFIEYLLIINSCDSLSLTELLADLSCSDIAAIRSLIRSLNCTYKKYQKFISKNENKYILINLYQTKQQKLKHLIDSLKYSIKENHSEILADGSTKRTLKFKITSKSFSEVIQSKCDLEHISTEYNLSFG